MRQPNTWCRLAAIFLLAGSHETWAAERPTGSASFRTANARLQGGPPPAPVPDPSLSPAPAPVPNPGTGPTPGATAAPVPPPDPAGATYSVPFGTIREKPEPVKEYLGDPGGIPSSRGNSGVLNPLPLDPNSPLPPLDPNPYGPTTDRFGVAPPPGTLGRTYQRRSQLIDEKKHPRVGIVEVHLSENYDVSAKGLKSKWTGQVWQLESDPLLPGIPHIFDVKAEWGPEGNKKREVRTVRLIMGRIVDLDF